jgi:7-cyano-7-deazaguanine reductase
MNSVEDSSLGKAVSYQGHYDAGLLYPIARNQQRQALGMDPNELPFVGLDIWNAYELSWLDQRGKPRVALAEFRIPADSTHIIESKSFKLYLNSYMQTRFADAETVRQQIAEDISVAVGATASVVLISPNRSADSHDELGGLVIDDVPIDIDHYGPPNPQFLKADQAEVVEEKLVSHLLKSNCPVTAQPDWASLQIYYRGPRMDRAGLLKYIVSYREHNDFHEQCVERMFIDIQRNCQPSKLSVYARYTRRGGLDINPFRASTGIAMPGNPRTVRQ